MKAILIVGMSNSMLAQCGGIIEAVQKPLIELGIELQTINLLERYIPYYEEGLSPENFTALASVIKEEKNVIFMYNVTNSTPGAAMKIFMEYFEEDGNKKYLEGKNIFNIAISKKAGEREAAECLAKMVAQCGGNELVRMLIGKNTFEALVAGTFPMEALEKYAEDFYRMSRQNRIFIPAPEYYGLQGSDGYEESFQGDYRNLRTQVEHSLENTKKNTLTGQGLNQMVGRENVSSNVYAGENVPMPPAFYEHPQSMSGMPQGGMTDPWAGGANPQRSHQESVFSPEFLAEIPPKERENTPGLNSDIFQVKHEEDIQELTKLFETKLKTDEMAQPSAMPPAVTYERPKPVQSPPFAGAVHMPIPDNGFGFVNPPGQSGMPGSAFGGGAEQFLPPQNGMYPQNPNSIMPEMGGFHGGPSLPPGGGNGAVTPRNKTIKQMTQSLPHFFQPQIAQGTEAVFQFNIFGDEEFYGYLEIKGGDNEYFEGKHDVPDITIIANASIWQEILRGKLTAQKAFMTGRLKVRGNFMLLNRFDQIYKDM